MPSLSQFDIGYLIEPHKNSRYDFDYENIQVGNLIYHSPLGNEFFWNTGDGELPCVNKEQIEYFQKWFGIVPQKIGTDVGEGFYSLKLKENQGQ